MKAFARWVGASQISKHGKSCLTADAMDSVSGSTRVYSFNTAKVSPWTCMMQPQKGVRLKSTPNMSRYFGLKCLGPMFFLENSG